MAWRLTIYINDMIYGVTLPFWQIVLHVKILRFAQDDINTSLRGTK